MRGVFCMQNKKETAFAISFLVPGAGVEPALQ